MRNHDMFARILFIWSKMIPIKISESYKTYENKPQWLDDWTLKYADQNSIRKCKADHSMFM